MTARKPASLGGRWTLLLIFILFLLPVVAAWIMNFGSGGWKPKDTTNHGRLITPPRPLPAVSLAGPEGDFLPADFLKQKWTLVYLHAGRCAQSCQQNLYKMRQARLAQGKNLDRVQRLLVVADRDSEASDKQLQAAWPGLVIAQPVGERASEFLEQFRLSADEPLAAQERIYLVDPYGNLMMSYESDAEPGGILKDLEHLLKWSPGG
jgi:cytochrome oxidase Cu insertion factor (SCO1/SenC/PrrC family)